MRIGLWGVAAWLFPWLAQGADPPSPAPGTWYTPSAWISWMRPELRSSLAPLAGTARLEDLPLYDLAVQLDPAQDSFTLREVVYLTNGEAGPEGEWVFRLYANVGTPVTGPNALGQPVPVFFVTGRCDSECSVRPDGPSIISVRPKVPVPPGGRIKVTLELRGALERIDASRTNLMAQGLEGLTSMLGGNSGGSYGLLAQGDGTVSLANFYPVLARRRGAAWDRSELKPIGDVCSDDLANVHATIELPKALHLAHNGIVVRQDVDARTSLRRVEIGAVMVRDFVLLAGAGLTSSSRSVGGVTVTSHYRQENRAAGAQVLDVAAHALSQFERRFGSYPYDRLDVVEAPLVGGAGGVEFSGLVTVASMFYGAQESVLMPAGSIDSAREFVTAHEVAHQWWHALVGSDSRESPFTDESLTQYSAMLYLEDRYGRDRAKRDGEMNVKMNYQMMRLLGQADGRVDGPAASFDSTIAYGGRVYGKGPYFYGAVRKLLGDQAFFQAVRAYVGRYRFRIAPPYGLVDFLAGGSQERQVRALARRWLSESHGDEDIGGGNALSLGGLLGGKGADGLPSGLLGDHDLDELLRTLMNQLGPGGLP